MVLNETKGSCFHMRSMFRSALVAFMAVSALGAVAATAAQAAEPEGPFWRVPCHKVSATNKGLGAFNEEGCKTAGGSKEWDTRLLGGEKNTVTAKAAKSFVLRLSFGGAVTCKKLSSKNAKAVGSTGASPGSREEQVTFEECTATGFGEGCHVEGEEITTVPVEYRSGYEKFGEKLGEESKGRRGKVLILFKPKEASMFTTIKLTGGSCLYKEGVLAGSVAAEVWSGGKAVEVGKEPAQTKVSEVNFPAKSIKAIFVENKGKVEEVKPVLQAFQANSVVFEGREEIELMSKESFGVFTQ